MPDPIPPPPKRPLPLLIGAGVAVVALGFGLPLLFTGNPESPPAPTPAAPAPDLGMSLLRLTVGFVVVCAVCVVAARLVGKPKAAAPGGMELLASLPVDPRCVVHLVRANGRRLLVGTDPAGVKVLVELPGPEPEPPPPEPVAEAAPVVVGPVAVLAPPARGEILALLAKLRIDPPDAPSPG